MLSENGGEVQGKYYSEYFRLKIDHTVSECGDVVLSLSHVLFFCYLAYFLGHNIRDSVVHVI